MRTSAHSVDDIILMNVSILQSGLVSVAFVIYIDKSFDDKLLVQTSAIYQETQKMVLEVVCVYIVFDWSIQPQHDEHNI